MTTAWFKKSDTEYVFVGLSQDAGLDGISRLVESPIGKIQYNPESNDWDSYLTSIGFLVSFPELPKLMGTVEELYKKQLQWP